MLKGRVDPQGAISSGRQKRCGESRCLKDEENIRPVASASGEKPAGNGPAEQALSSNHVKVAGDYSVSPGRRFI